MGGWGMEIVIISAYAGTGKTTLANMYPDKYVDFVLMPYKYELEEDGNNDESGKANPDNILRPDWPYNYLAAIREAMREGKHLFIPTDHLVLIHLHAKNIPYVLCYPERDAKEVYRQRYINRGNSENFIDIFADHWDNWMDFFAEDTYGCHIVLRPDEFLSDAIDRLPCSLDERLKKTLGNIPMYTPKFDTEGNIIIDGDAPPSFVDWMMNG